FPAERLAFHLLERLRHMPWRQRRRTMVLIHRASWVAALCVAAAGCASAADGTGTTSNEPTGEIAAAIERVPDDVRCVVLTVSVYYPNYSYRYVVQDVTPGDSSVIRVGALTAGYGNVSGQAYSTPCQRYYDSSYPPAPESETWISDFQSFYVQSGRITPVQ